MPEKTIYCLTEKGAVVLKKSIEQYLSSIDLDPIAFHIGIYLMCQLDKDFVNLIFNTKLKAMDSETFMLKKQLDENPMPYISQAIIKHRIYLMFSEAKTIRDMLEKMELDLLWNKNLALDSYEQLQSNAAG